MTAMELKCLKMDLVEELLSIDDKDTLNRVKNYLKKLNNKIRTKAEEEETEYISKEEILAGIDAGLKEMQERKRSGKRAKTLEQTLSFIEIGFDRVSGRDLCESPDRDRSRQRPS